MCVGTNICNDLEGLKNARELRDGDLELHIGNETRVAIKAIGKYYLLLPNVDLEHKNEAFNVFKVFQNELHNQLGKKIKTIRSDRGGEYLSYEFDEHVKNCGIVSQLTPSRKSQHNGVSEKRNRTLLDMVRSMMSHTSLPHSFWGYAHENAARIVNMVPTKKIWGFESYVKIETSIKLDPRSQKYILVGYPKETMSYYFFQKEENRVFIARKVVFLETDFILHKASGSPIDLEEIRETQPLVENDNQ
uniref:Integrase catalytic domain-containing protein n=1 Tax=Lactuca sativa TaxID=4236 RepID=A0A9R1WU96_LACSA|nr:hypothetical protein LSAT_V11C900464960 [Lactuca sativa]